jgi:hypothetical protein
MKKIFSATFIFLGAICLLVIFIGVRKFGKEDLTENKVPPMVSATSSRAQFKKDDIIIVEMLTNSIKSPFVISGKARGPWYFEASFPIEIVDANGIQLGRAIGQAKGDWMTTEFVPFTATLSFATSSTKTGSIILHKDNPSGEPSRDESLRIPILFSVFEEAPLLEGFEVDPRN